jgi:uncharacterized membrane protein YebE (DUF533 family)
MKMAEENQFLQVIRVWAGLAWADDVIADEEAAAMSKLIATAGLAEPEKAVALGYLESKVELETEGLEGLNENARFGIYKAAVRLAGVDKEFAPEERKFLDRLRDGLAIGQDIAQKIEADVPLPE